MVRVKHAKTGTVPKVKHRKTVKKTKGTAKKTTSAMSGNAILAALMNDTSGMKQLTDAIASSLFSGGFTAEIINAIEAVVGVAQSSTAGRLLAGTIGSGASSLQLNGSSKAISAMVSIGGAATAVPCYVPTYLRADIALSDEVWVMPINGNMGDLMVFSLRNIF